MVWFSMAMLNNQRVFYLAFAWIHLTRHRHGVMKISALCARSPWYRLTRECVQWNQHHQHVILGSFICFAIDIVGICWYWFDRNNLQWCPTMDACFWGINALPQTTSLWSCTHSSIAKTAVHQKKGKSWKLGCCITRVWSDFLIESTHRLCEP